MSKGTEVEITVKITPAQLREAIIAHFGLPAGPATRVEFVLTTKSHGYGPAEISDRVFDGAKATFKRPLKEVL